MGREGIGSHGMGVGLKVTGRDRSGLEVTGCDGSGIVSDRMGHEWDCKFMGCDKRRM